MSRRMHGLKGLGLALLALCGLMAAMAASAQANWLENGAELTANKNVTAKAHTTGKLLVSSLNFEIRCTTVKGEGLKVVAKSGTAEGKVAFSGCTAFQISDGKEQKNCKPSEPITAGGKALLVLHNAKNYVLFEPETGKPFTTITLSELCALAETSDVTGSLVAECGTLSGGVFAGEDCNVARAEHLLQPAPAALFTGDKLAFGENAATLQGIAAVELESKNSWAGHI